MVDVACGRTPVSSTISFGQVSASLLCGRWNFAVVSVSVLVGAVVSSVCWWLTLVSPVVGAVTVVGVGFLAAWGAVGAVLAVTVLLGIVPVAG